MTARTYSTALAEQQTARAVEARGGRPYPERITMALDVPAGGGPTLEGPEVDLACDAVEPAVDHWETGEEVPTAHQLELLAALTGYPVAFFYEPPVIVDGGFLCVRSGPGKGCYPATGELTPAQDRALARALAPPKPARPKPAPLALPADLRAGELPDCLGPCALPMRRDVWVRRQGRCSTCGPA